MMRKSATTIFLSPFSLKGDAKTWFNTLAPSCVHSPQDMIYYFSMKYFPAHKKQAVLRKYLTSCKFKKRISIKLGEASPINLCFA